MLPAAHVKRVRIQSAPTHKDCELTSNLNQDLDNDQFVQRATLAESCTESSYNSALNVNILNEAVRKDPSLILIRFFQKKSLEHLISLRTLRRLLLTGNISVLASTILFFSAWSTINVVKNAHQGRDAHPWVEKHLDPTIALSLPYLDKALLTFAGYLTLYYMVFGFVISLFFGGPTDLLVIVLMTPVIVSFSAALIALAIAVLYFRSIFHENLHLLEDYTVRNHMSLDLQSSLVKLHILLDRYGILFSVIAFLTSFVKICMVILPWCIYDIPFQRMLDIEDLVIHDIKNRNVHNYPRSLDDHAQASLESGSEGPALTPIRRPYRSMPAAQTVLLQLCSPELRDLHRWK